MAPKPVIIVACVGDFINVDGTGQTF